MTNTDSNDGAPDPAVRPTTDDAHPMRQYASVLRRRWVFVVVGTLLGLLAGIVSTFMIDDTVDPTSYYKATNTLVVDRGSSSNATNDVAANLPQTALFLHSADVLRGVAEQLDLEPGAVSDQVAAVPLPELSVIDVTAISTDPKQAVDLADTAAKALTDYVDRDEQSRYTQSRDDIVGRLDKLAASRDALQAQLIASGGDPTVQTQLESTLNQYRVTNEELQQLAAKGEPGGTFSSLQGATPIQISARAYNTRLRANRDAVGDSRLAAQTKTDSADAIDFSETDLGGGAPSKRVRVVVGTTTGFLLGVITAFVVEAWDDRLRRRQRTESVTGLPVIAELPILADDQRGPTDVVVVDAPASRPAERYRSARAAILFLLNQRSFDVVSSGAEADGSAVGSPVVMVTSPSPSEGKTTTAANVAAALGDSGVRTLAIDCDYHNPRLGDRLGPDVDAGELGRPAPTRLPNVWYIPAPKATGRPSDSMATMRDTIARWRAEFEIVVLDTPPMLTTNDAVDLLGSSDAVVLVLRAGQTRTGPAAQASQVLERFGANVLGIVLNGCSASEIDGGYGDSYGYGYYPEDTSRRRRSSRTRPAAEAPEPSTDRDDPALSPTPVPGDARP